MKCIAFLLSVLLELERNRMQKKGDERKWMVCILFLCCFLNAFYFSCIWAQLVLVVFT